MNKKKIKNLIDGFKILTKILVIISVILWIASIIAPIVYTQTHDVTTNVVINCAIVSATTTVYMGLTLLFGGLAHRYKYGFATIADHELAVVLTPLKIRIFKDGVLDKEIKAKNHKFKDLIYDLEGREVTFVMSKKPIEIY